MDKESTTLSDRGMPGPTGIDMGFAVGFFFSFRWILGLFAITVLGMEAHTSGVLSLALNFLLLGFVCVHSLGAATEKFTSGFGLNSLRWVMMFLLFSLISFAWSSTASLPASLIYWCAMTADVAMVILLLRAAPAIRVASSLFKGFIWSTCLIAIIVWIMPPQPDLRLGNKDFFNTNQIGNLCAFAIFLAQYLMRRKEGRWGLAAIFLSVTLLRSLSKATIVAFLVSEAFLIIQDRTMSRRTKMFLTAGAVLMVLAFWGLLESYYVVYTNAGNQAETLTGRVGIWIYVLNAALQQPWIGHGFDSIWKIVPPFGPDQFEARHAENEVLQQFYAYGAVGVCLMAGLYGSLYRQLCRAPRGSIGTCLLSLLLYIVVRGFAEAEPFDLLLPLWAITLISLLSNELSCELHLERQESVALSK